MRNNFKVIPEQWQLVEKHHHLWKLQKFPQFVLLCICYVIPAATLIPVTWHHINFLQSTLALQNPDCSSAQHHFHTISYIPKSSYKLVETEKALGGAINQTSFELFYITWSQLNYFPII